MRRVNLMNQGKNQLKIHLFFEILASGIALFYEHRKKIMKDWLTIFLL